MTPVEELGGWRHVPLALIVVPALLLAITAIWAFEAMGGRLRP